MRLLVPARLLSLPLRVAQTRQAADEPARTSGGLQELVQRFRC